MSDFRLPYVATAMAGLQTNPDRDTAVDVLGAAGKANARGVDLWRTAFGLEKTAYYRLRNDVLKAFRERYPREAEAVRVVEQAIHEFCGPGCSECEGTGMIGALDLGKARATCPTCNGTKVRRYSDSMRATMMKLSYGKTKHLAFKINWVMTLLSHADKDTNRTINTELQRD